jgi:hypothetical protein
MVPRPAGDVKFTVGRSTYLVQHGTPRPVAIFEAAWQMIVEAHSRRPGSSDELKFRISIETFQRNNEPRYTNDLDIWIAATSANAAKVYAALAAFGAPLNRTSVPSAPGLLGHVGQASWPVRRLLARSVRSQTYFALLTASISSGTI